jgi:hypothetical protein
MIEIVLALLLGAHVETGLLSYYEPGPGRNELSCGGKYTRDQLHIAHRRWRELGCGWKVTVCAQATGRCVRTEVRDAGPWGVLHGPLRHAGREGRWMPWFGRRPPPGWRWRAAVDLSVGLWVLLGRPPGLSRVTLIFDPHQ